MKVLIIGCGLVGKELARQLRDEGHHVVGTTTTPAKVDSLREVCDDVEVLTGADTDKVHAAADGVDAVVVAAGPNAAQAMTIEQRQRTYRQVLADTAASVASAPGDPYLIMLSSLLAVIYVWKIVEVMYFRPVPEGARFEEAPWQMLVPTYVLVGASLWFGIDATFTGDVAVSAANTLLGGSR